MGLSGMYYGVIMAHGMSFIPSHMTGRGTTLLNFFSIGGTGLMQGISGFVYESANVPGEPISGFTAVIWLYIACSVVAAVTYAFSKDVKPNDAKAVDN